MPACRKTKNENLLICCGGSSIFFMNSKGELLDAADTGTWSQATVYWSSPKMEVPRNLLPAVQDIARRFQKMVRPTEMPAIPKGSVITIVFHRLFYQVVKKDDGMYLAMSSITPKNKEEWNQHKMWTCIYMGSGEEGCIDLVPLEPFKINMIRVPVEKITLIELPEQPHVKAS